LNQNRGMTIGAGGGTISVDSGRTLTYGGGGIIAGTGTLTVTGGGKFTVSSNSTWTGPLVVNGGSTISISNQTILNPRPTPPITCENGTLEETNRGANGTFSPTSRNIVLGPNGGTLSYTTANTLIILQSPTVISGSGSLTKAGAGIISVVTPATYTGATIVNA